MVHGDVSPMSAGNGVRLVFAKMIRAESKYLFLAIATGCPPENPNCDVTEILNGLDEDSI